MCEMKVDEWNSEVVGSKAEKVNEFKDSGSIVQRNEEFGKEMKCRKGGVG